MSKDRVLITRPEPASVGTAKKVSELGFAPVLMPLFKTLHLPLPAGLKPADFAAVAFTSQNAVAATNAEFAEEVANRGLAVFAVGKATGTAAHEAGFRTIHTGPGTGREMARLIIANSKKGGAEFSSVRPLLYLTGVERSPDFEEALQQAGLAVTTAEIYRMEIISYTTDFFVSDSLSPFPKFVLLYSANAARRFSELFLTQVDVLPDLPVIPLCLSKEVADALAKPLQMVAKISDEPNEASLLERLAAIG